MPWRRQQRWETATTRLGDGLRRRQRPFGAWTGGVVSWRELGGCFACFQGVHTHSTAPSVTRTRVTCSSTTHSNESLGKEEEVSPFVESTIGNSVFSLSFLTLPSQFFFFSTDTILRILLKQNTALLSHVCWLVTGVTSQVFSIIRLF